MTQETAQNFRSITNWPEDERPREKLERFGPDKVSDAELIAILLRTGIKDESAVDIARRILKESGGVENLGKMSIASLKRVKGIGPAKAVTIGAAFQLGLRFARANNSEKWRQVHCSKDVAEYFGPQLSILTVEIFQVLILNSNNRVTNVIQVSQGHLSAAAVHPREIFKAAIDHLASSIILMHNHPSGNIKPSNEDLRLTRQLVSAGEMLGIPVRDHIIIGGNDFLSFADQGYL
jgi:DNA repair protein RadC